jgi:uncharacterized protein
MRSRTLFGALLLSFCASALSCVCNCGSTVKIMHATALRPMRSPRMVARRTSSAQWAPYLASNEADSGEAVVVEEENAKDADFSDAVTAPDGVSTAMINFIKAYKRELSPLLPPACRFYPTCSEYAMESIQDFGPQKGFILMVRLTPLFSQLTSTYTIMYAYLHLKVWRLLRCTPFGGYGYDPPQWPPPQWSAGIHKK